MARRVLATGGFGGLTFWRGRVVPLGAVSVGLGLGPGGWLAYHPAMAQKVVTLYTDDLTGEESEDISTHTILVDGAGVEIDLTSDSHDQLMDALRPFLQAAGARRVRGGAAGSTRKERTRSAQAATGREAADIRIWAKENGYEVSDRGRVPASVKEAYESAN